MTMAWCQIGNLFTSFPRRSSAVADGSLFSIYKGHTVLRTHRVLLLLSLYSLEGLISG